MHILIIPSEHFMTQAQPLGGIFQYHQAKALKSLGNQIGVISSGFISPRDLLTERKYSEEESINAINILRCYQQLYIPYRFSPFSWLCGKIINISIGLFKQYVSKFGMPDIIHAHNFFYAGIIAEKIKSIFNIPYLITEHSSLFVKKKFHVSEIEAIRSCAKNSTAVTAVSSALVNVLNRFVDKPIDILPNVIDDFFFCSYENYKKVNEFIFLNIASLDINKNQKLLMAAFAHKFSGEKAVLRIGGDGYMLNKLKSYAKYLGIEAQVKFLGRLNQEEVRNEMRLANCFVLPSNYETFGVVLIEALACGTPLIATKCGGPEDIVNEKNGILVDPGNGGELADAMKFMYENIDQYTKQTLMNDAENRFGKNAFMENVLRYYQL